ncbi:MAG: hypothetical protein ACC614_03820 [Methanobacterium formicicum]|uniref:hypothetical protein n=1 Tax=Methanobacterium formicicum TaxID=2162 RepID=UPI003530DB07
MTICIAAICIEDGEDHIVFATDHLLTFDFGQHEHSFNKYKEINEKTVGMIAGETLYFDCLLDLENYNAPLNVIAKAISENFHEKRQELIKMTILNSYGLENEPIWKLMTSPAGSCAQSVLSEINTFRLNTSILLAGITDSKNAEIYDISDGEISNFTTMHFHAIGSGSSQARNTLLFQRQSKNDNLSTTIYNVYKAKRSSEINEDVGKDTEIGIIGNNVKNFKKNNLEILEEIYQDELQYGREHEKLKELNFN